MKSLFTVTKNILKIGFVVLVFYYLSKKNLISAEAMKKALSQWEMMLRALFALVITVFLGVFRWHGLLKAQDIHIKRFRVLQLSMIGGFFNIALPGAVSGDFVKMYYVGQEARGHKTRAMSSIVFDRVTGLSGLVMIAALSFLVGGHHFVGTPLLAGIRFFILCAFLFVLSFYIYLFFVKERHDPLLQILRRFESRWIKLGVLVRIYLELRRYHHHRKIVLKSILISLVIHVFVCFACLSFLLALGDSIISRLPIFVAVPLGLLVTAIPLTPAGIGTGHIAFSEFFHLIGSNRGADVFSLYMVTQVISACIGGLIYLRFKSKIPKGSFQN